MSEKLKRPERPCCLPEAGNNCQLRSLESCLACGWNPAEAERRRALPLERGEDGRYHKNIGQDEISNQPGGD